MELKAYEILKDKLGDEKAAVVLDVVGGKVNHFEEKMDNLEGRVVRLEGKIDLQKEIFLTKEDKMELIRSAKEDKVDLIKWMAGFWIAQIAAILGLYLKR